MSEILVGIIGLLVLLLLFSTGIELGFAMALVGFAGFAYLNGFHSAINLLSRDFFDVITTYGYTVFPLFILMGQIGFNAGIAVRLYDTAHKFIGHVPGGLAMATVGSRLLSGDEKIRDEKKGREWLKKAIEAKEYSAYLALGDYEENVKKEGKHIDDIWSKTIFTEH